MQEQGEKRAKSVRSRSQRRHSTQSNDSAPPSADSLFVPSFSHSQHNPSSGSRNGSTSSSTRTHKPSSSHKSNHKRPRPNRVQPVFPNNITDENRHHSHTESGNSVIQLTTFYHSRASHVEGEEEGKGGGEKKIDGEKGEEEEEKLVEHKAMKEEEKKDQGTTEKEKKVFAADNSNPESPFDLFDPSECIYRCADAFCEVGPSQSLTLLLPRIYLDEALYYPNLFPLDLSILAGIATF